MPPHAHGTAESQVQRRFGRVRRWRSWTLRTRIVVAQLILLAVVCAAISAGTMTALQRYLVHQLDQQVIDAGWRSAILFSMGPPPVRPGVPPLSDSAGPDFLNAPGQSSDTLGAVLSGGQVQQAAVVTNTGGRKSLSSQAYRQLADAWFPHPTTIDIDGAGSYRVITIPTPSGETVLTGLPTAGVNTMLLSMLGILCVIVALALVVAAVIGILIIRRQLAPLSAVAKTARQVADSGLGSGDVDLARPIAEVDPVTRFTEVGQLGAALNRMLERIGDAMASRQASETRVRQFVADASHELRTPLTSIRGYAELAQRHRDELPEPVAHAMGRIHSEAKRMTTLVEDMLLLAQLDAGRPLEHELVDLSGLLADAVSDAHVAAPQHHWRLDLPEQPLFVVGDSARLQQVIANLLSNARTHTPAGTTVTATLSCPDDGHVHVTVSDDGPGIPVEQQAEIFGRFVRGDSSRSRRAGSTGLGLAIVDAVVKAHQGTISVKGGPGTTFEVVLPATSQGSDPTWPSKTVPAQL
ncbi:MAG: HAMP domain-containing histidine kinase [Mycobacterium sp.]|nr:HAMP domain-containing histidine kinase [Mycobacterium sp.]